VVRTLKQPGVSRNDSPENSSDLTSFDKQDLAQRDSRLLVLLLLFYRLTQDQHFAPMVPVDYTLRSQLNLAFRVEFDAIYILITSFALGNNSLVSRCGVIVNINLTVYQQGPLQGTLKKY